MDVIAVNQDEKFDEKAHASLLEELKGLSSKKQKIGKGKTVRVSSEYTPSLNINDILKKIGDNNLLTTSKHSKTLSKPLEKPASKRLKRAAGYEEVVVDVNKWEGIVNQRRKANQLTFPLEQVDIRVVTTERNFKPSLKSNLEKEVYSLLSGAKLIEEKKETEEEVAIKKAMSLKEIRNKSREMWKAKLLRHRLEKKAFLLNKSKSRKYHKILRHERTRKKKDEFEKLKHSDPEAALKVLEEIDKDRVLERMSLRHKKSKYLHLQRTRAGQDKMAQDVFKENADMRNELLEKLKMTMDSDEDDKEDNIVEDQEDQPFKNMKKLTKSQTKLDDDFGAILKEQERAISKGQLDPDNAWVRQLAVPEKETVPDPSFDRFTQFWETRKSKLNEKQNSENLRLVEAKKVEEKETDSLKQITINEKENNFSANTKSKKSLKARGGKVVLPSKVSPLVGTEGETMDKKTQLKKRSLVSSKGNELESSKVVVKKIGEVEAFQKQEKKLVSLSKKKSPKGLKTNESNNEHPSKMSPDVKARKIVIEEIRNEAKLKKRKRDASQEGKKLEHEKVKSKRKGNAVNCEIFIDEMFDKAEKNLIKTLDRKFADVTSVSPTKDNSRSTEVIDGEELEFDFQSKSTHSQIDESLTRVKTLEDINNLEVETESKGTKTIERALTTSNKQQKKVESQVESNPLQEVRCLGSRISDRAFLKKRLEEDSDNEFDDEGGEDNLRDLLHDEDNIKQFKAEKAAEEEKRKVKDVDLFMQGWGSWAGPGIVYSKKVKRKFRIKAPQAPPSKYSHVGNVIYNEENDIHSNIRKIMVSDLPYPFTSVKDFEASIRQPIGRMFVPENSHRKLTAPSLVHKMGTVIPPMNEEALLRHHDKTKKKSKLEQKMDSQLKRGRPQNRKGLKHKASKGPKLTIKALVLK